MSVITHALVLGATEEDMRSLNRETYASDTDRHQVFGKVPGEVLAGHTGAPGVDLCTGSRS